MIAYLLLIPLGRGHADFSGEDTGKDSRRGEAALFSDVLHEHVGMGFHELFGLLDAIVGDKLVKIAAVLGIDELAEIGAVERKNLSEIQESELGIKVGFLGLHPLFQCLAVLSKVNRRSILLFLGFFGFLGIGFMGTHRGPGVIAVENLLGAISDHQ